MRDWSSWINQSPSPLLQWELPLFEEKGLECWIKRDDHLQFTVLGNPFALSGNKCRKLKYNLLEADRRGYQRLLTFGGAYSNHIAAVAAAGHLFDFQTIGMIRGERIEPLNPTLAHAEACGMRLHFVSRAEYRRKKEKAFLDHLKAQFGEAYLIPEGGTNALAMQGTAELASELLGQSEALPDYVLVCAGTGGTAAGLIKGLKGKSQVLAYAVLKGDFLINEIKQLLHPTDFNNWTLIQDAHLGGYAKTNPDLLAFIEAAQKNWGLPLDPIYTGKLCFGFIRQVRADQFPAGSKIVVVHSGGLQGVAGFQARQLK